MEELLDYCVALILSRLGFGSVLPSSDESEDEDDEDEEDDSESEVFSFFLIISFQSSGLALVGRAEGLSALSESVEEWEVFVDACFFFDWLRSRGTRLIMDETCGDDGSDEPGSPGGLFGVFMSVFSDFTPAEGIIGDAKEHGGRQRMDVIPKFR